MHIVFHFSFSGCSVVYIYFSLPQLDCSARLVSSDNRDSISNKIPHRRSPFFEGWRRHFKTSDEKKYKQRREKEAQSLNI